MSTKPKIGPPYITAPIYTGTVGITSTGIADPNEDALNPTIRTWTTDHTGYPWYDAASGGAVIMPQPPIVYHSFWHNVVLNDGAAMVKNYYSMTICNESIEAVLKKCVSPKIRWSTYSGVLYTTELVMDTLAVFIKNNTESKFGSLSASEFLDTVLGE